MPKRPRQHQLEDESRIEFERLLPSHWIFRKKDSDYGIDAEVEVFDETEQSTGQLFFVQLKATGKTELSSALAVRLSRDKYEYFHSFSVPVLMVLYHEPTEAIFIKWFHTYDPYHTKKDAARFTFRFAEDDRWGEQTLDQLQYDLLAFKQIRSPELQFPITLALVIKEPELFGVAAGILASAIREAASSGPRLIEIQRQASGPTLGQIEISTDTIVCRLAGMPFITLHLHADHFEDAAVNKFPRDVLLGVGFALDAAGHSNLAAQLISSHVADSSISEAPEIILRVAGCFARAGKVAEALLFSERLFDKDAHVEIQFLILQALEKIDKLTENEREHLLAFLKKYLRHAERVGDKQMMASAQYTLGNYLRIDQPRMATRLYRQAAENDLGYCKRAYFWRELGGIMFENRRWRMAAKLYGLAIDHGAPKEVIALQADALMFSGCYGHAKKAFETYIDAVPEPASEWLLKTLMLGGLQNVVGAEQQSRDPRGAAQSCAEFLVDHDVGKLEDALRQDALCSTAWFNLGVYLGERNEDQVIAFLAAALICPGDSEAWVNCLILAVQEEYQPVWPHIAKTAYWFVGEQLLPKTLIAAQKTSTDFPANDLVNVLNEFISQNPNEPQPFEARVLGKGGEFEILQLHRK